MVVVSATNATPTVYIYRYQRKERTVFDKHLFQRALKASLIGLGCRIAILRSVVAKSGHMGCDF